MDRLMRAQEDGQILYAVLMELAKAFDHGFPHPTSSKASKLWSNAGDSKRLPSWPTLYGESMACPLKNIPSYC